MRLLRLASAVPIFALMSCWDFTALNATNTPQFSDGGEVDMYFCDKSPLSIAEDCTDGIDNNDDCRTDCEDPQCATTHLKCVDPTNQIIGYGNKIQATNNCPGSQTTTSINQNLALAGDCSTGCACQTNTNWRCGSTLHVSRRPGQVHGQYGARQRLASKWRRHLAAQRLRRHYRHRGGDGLLQDRRHHLDLSGRHHQDGHQVRPRGATRRSSARRRRRPPPARRSLCMAAAGNCIAFNGNMASCPSPFAFKEVWYRNYTDNRTCTCSCAAGAGSCVINGGQAQFTDSMMCMTGGGEDRQCHADCSLRASGSGRRHAAAAFSFQARPACASSGTAPTDLAAEMTAGRVSLNNPITLCCQQ